MRATAGVLVAAVLAIGWWTMATAAGYPALALGALVLGTVAAGGALVGLTRDKDALAGVGSILTAVLVPTFFAYVAKVALLVAGIVLLVGAARRRPPTAAASPSSRTGWREPRGPNVVGSGAQPPNAVESG